MPIGVETGIHLKGLFPLLSQWEGEGEGEGQEETFCPASTRGSTIQAVPTPGPSACPGTSSVGEDCEYPNIRVLSFDISLGARPCLPARVRGPTIYPVLLSGT